MDNFYLGQEDEKDVNDLLAQFNDESILKMSVNTHQSTNGMHTPVSDDQQEVVVGKDGIDPDLDARFASLKAPRPKAKEKGTTGKSKHHHGDVSATSKSSKGDSKVEQTGRGIVRSNSFESDGGDSLDVELIARLQALKGPSVPSKMPEGETISKPGISGSNTPTLSEHLQALKSRSKKSPQMSPSRSDYHAGMTVTSTSVGSSGWCAPSSPFKLMKALSSKIPIPEPVSSASLKSHSSQTTKDAKKAVKKSLSHTSKEDDKVDTAAMVEDVQRLLAAVSKEGSKQSSAKEAMVAGDKRTFNMKDRDVELLSAMEDEEAIALEAEKVVEWAKDNARLQGSEEESEDELELEARSSDDSDDSAGVKIKPAKKKTVLEDSDPEETIGKGKKRKGQRRWNFI